MLQHPGDRPGHAEQDRKMDCRRSGPVFDPDPQYSFPDGLISVRKDPVHECTDLCHGRFAEHHLV